MTSKKQTQAKLDRALRVRKRLISRTDLPRLIVKRSLNHLHAQIIDLDGKVLAAASSVSLPDVKGTKTEVAREVGVKLAASAKEKQVTAVVLDRGQLRFHGRLKALVEALRENGIKI